MAQTMFPENLSGLQGEEEERIVVGHGRNVVGVGPGESAGIVGSDQLRKEILPTVARQINRIELGVKFAMCCDGVLFRRSKRRLLSQDHDRNAVFVERSLGNNDEVARWVGNAHLMKRF